MRRAQSRVPGDGVGAGRLSPEAGRIPADVSSDVAAPHSAPKRIPPFRGAVSTP
jgi:hypothetical protein